MDAFEALGVARRLTFSEEELREAFREAGKHAHPDAGGREADFARVQEAFRTLFRPSSRLKHWLVLQDVEGDERGAISGELMDLFGEVGTVLQRADALSRKRAETRSALALALLESGTQACREEIEAMIARVDARIAEQTAAFPSIEAAADPADAWERVRNLAFLEKWRANLQEKFARLV